MAVKNEQKLPRKEQNKSEDTSKQKVEARREQRNSISPLEQLSATPKQDALNEALANAGANMAANAMTDAMSTPTLATLVQQYADRAERQGNIAPGSIDPSRDTVYRVGADDPYGYFSQSQLNNNMSGPDANAIYQATHDQRGYWTYGDRNPRHNVSDMLDVNGNRAIPEYDTPQQYNDWLREEGYLPNTGRQLSMPVYGDGAYVSGADAWSNANYDDVLPAGVGSVQGIPREYLSSYDKYLSDLDRSGDWYDRRAETIREWMDRDRLNRWNSGRGKNW